MTEWRLSPAVLRRPVEPTPFADLSSAFVYVELALDRYPTSMKSFVARSKSLVVVGRLTTRERLKSIFCVSFFFLVAASFGASVYDDISTGVAKYSSRRSPTSLSDISVDPGSYFAILTFHTMMLILMLMFVALQACRLVADWKGYVWPEKRDHGRSRGNDR
jgi:hypothetical protein